MTHTDLENEIRNVLARQEELLTPPTADLARVIARSRKNVEEVDPARYDRRVWAVAAAIVVLAGGSAVFWLSSSDGTPTVADRSTTTQVDPPTTLLGPDSSISQITDAARLLSDAAPEGFELSEAFDNADLGPPTNTNLRAVYVDRLGDVAIRMEKITPTDPESPLAHSDESASYDSASVVDIDGIEVTVHGVDVRRASLKLGETFVTIDLPWHAEPAAGAVADETLLAAAEALVSSSDPLAFPAEIEAYVLVGVEETGDYSSTPTVQALVAAPDGSTTTYRKPRSAERPPSGDFIRIQSRPIVEGRIIPPDQTRLPDDLIVYLDGIPVTVSPPGLVLTYEGGSSSPVLRDISDPESQYLWFILGGHYVSLRGEGVSQSELIAAAAALRAPNDDEWDAGLPR